MFHTFFQILLSIPDGQVRRMQWRIRQLWHRFIWIEGPVMSSALDQVLDHRSQKESSSDQQGEQGTVTQQHYEAAEQDGRGNGGRNDDAFATLMQWLFSKISNATRRPKHDS